MEKNEHIKPKIIITAGGTGGHTIPALCIAKKLLETKRYSLEFITDLRGIKNLSIPNDLPTGILNLNLYTKKGCIYKFLGLIELLYSTLIVLLQFLKNRPNRVIGFGGFPSFPVIFSAFLLRIPYALHEQNAILGKVNRYFQKWSKILFLSFENTKKVSAHSVVVGNPVRDEFDKTFPTSNNFNFLILGGSQGASIFSKIIPLAFQKLDASLFNNITVYQQVRKEDKENVQKLYHGLGIKAYVETFFSNIPELMNQASWVISRGGASTIAELMHSNKKALIIPYPFAMDDHQKLNASLFVEKGYGFMIEEKDLSTETMALFLEECLRSKDFYRDKQEPFKANIFKIIEIIEKLTEQK